VWDVNDVGVKEDVPFPGFSRPSGGGLGEFKIFERSKSRATSSLGSATVWCNIDAAFRVRNGIFGVSVDNVFIVSSTFRTIDETRRFGSREVTLLCRKLRVPTLETSAEDRLETFFSIFRRVISDTIGLPMVTRLTDVRTRTDELLSTETVTGPL